MEPHFIFYTHTKMCLHKLWLHKNDDIKVDPILLEYFCRAGPLIINTNIKYLLNTNLLEWGSNLVRDCEIALMYGEGLQHINTPHLH